MRASAYLKHLPPLFAVLLYFSTSFPKLDSTYRSLLYAAVFFVIAISNFLRIHFTYNRGLDWRLTYYIPTAAASFRTLICFAFIFIAGSNYYNQTLPVVYLLYYSLLCTYFDHIEYHTWYFRGIRFLLDVVFGFWIYWKFGRLNNIGWLAFLVPIMVLARYYDIWKVYVLFFLIFTTITLDAILNNLISFSLINGFFVNFHAYLQEGSNNIYWSNSKRLFEIVFILLLIIGIFHAETKLRFTEIFDFGRELAYWIKSKGRKISIELLNYICYSVNVECLVGVKINQDRDSEKILYSFQTHSYPLNSGIANFNIAQNKQFRSWSESKVFNNVHKDESLKKFHKRFDKYLNPEKSKNPNRILPQLFKELDVPFNPDNDKIWEFNTRTDENIISQFQSIFFTKDCIITTNSGDKSDTLELLIKSKMYENHKVINLVVIELNEWRLYFVNNFPTNYRVVPRRFWNYSIEKIYTFLNMFLLEQ